MGLQADTVVQPQTGQSTFAHRARALVAQLSLAEKLALVHQVSPGVERLGIKAFRTGTEALHGVSWLGTATVFPQPVGLAATWDTDLVQRVGDAVATEVRAKHADDPTVSLNVWAPVVNPLRNPLWGRNEEGFSEDPCLTAQIATAYARGLRGEHPVFWKTVPTLKHYLAYNNEIDRSVTSSQMRPRVLHEYELPAYRGPVQAGVIGAVMPSYNLVNGRPNHVAHELLEELRSWTEQSLLVVSDAAAPTNLVESERYFSTHAASHAASLRAGVDSFTDNDADAEPTTQRLTAALEAGLIVEADLDRAVVRLLELRLRTGEFDVETDPYAHIGADAVDLPGHRALAREATARGVVVLANDGLLPLAGDHDGAPARIAVVGPLANRVLHDWYSGTPPYLTGLGQALTDRLPGSLVEIVDGADRVGLWSRSTGHYVAVSEGSAVPGSDAGLSGSSTGEHASPDAPTVLLASSPDCSEAAQLDVTDWGEGVLTLRSVATGQLVSGASWILSADASRVGGWVAQETFRLHRHDDASWSLKHIASCRWLRVQSESGMVVAEATSVAAAERFEVRTLVSGVAEVARAAAAADVVVVAVGNDPHINGRETEDRPGLDLPAGAQAVWRAAHEANDRSVLAIISSYPYTLGAIADQASAVLWSCHAGQELGPGLTEVLVGDVEPTGRLAQTWVADQAHAGDVLDYDIVAARSTYWYSPHAPLYAFGHGLTYSTVDYSGLTLSTSVVDAAELLTEAGRAGSPANPVTTVTATVTVTNSGERAAHELVQVYTAALHLAGTPLRRLAGHARVTLAPGQSAQVSIDVDPQTLATWDVRANRLRVAPGDYRVSAGPSSADLPQHAVLEVTGRVTEPFVALGASLRAADFDRAEHTVIAEETQLYGDAIQVAPGCHTGWIELADLDFTGVQEIVLRTARLRPGVATVGLECSDGARAARLEVCSGGGRYDWHDTVVPLLVGSWGPGPLRIRLTGAARLSTLTFR
ncbi:glycoside hydrolase family 3 C-terminal domain-containing protein [Sanguibacter suarezii]|uniref:glycoside hydrolase family 3 C-terminal domain-containing protein n=1 Tax=Sanguibacter suarezii TaxID=60921 RepID=UPI0008335B62|nr:glycoside hydrolase family 3 C-terminal domain-containing protein [Sanguibacter suarezii]